MPALLAIVRCHLALLFVLLSGSLFSWGVVADANANTNTSAKKILWLQSDIPPCHITSGKLKDQGFCDKVFAEVTAQLPQYRHQVKPVNLSRYLQLMKRDTFFCASEFLPSPERRQFMLFSRPFIGVLPNGVMVRAEDSRFEAYVDQQVQLDFAAAIQDTGLVLGIQAQRVYQGIIDEVIQAYQQQAPNAPHILVLQGGTDPVPLLQKQRFDYTLHYPASMFYRARLANVAQREAQKVRQDVRYLPVQGAEPLLMMHFSCSKGALGERVITAINEILAKSDPVFFAGFYREWLPEELKDYYIQAIKRANAVGYSSELGR